MSRRIGLLGLSGVGKSTLISRVHNSVPLVHLQASSLIKQEQARRVQYVDSSEALRLGAVLDNQSLLIAAFRRESCSTQLPIIFDGHSVIDGREGLVPIPSAVFKELELDSILFLSAPPALIAARRQADSGRIRPERNIDVLREQQRIARDVAMQIAHDVDASFLDLTEDNIGRLLKLVR